MARYTLDGYISRDADVDSTSRVSRSGVTEYADVSRTDSVRNPTDSTNITTRIERPDVSSSDDVVRGEQRPETGSTPEVERENITPTDVSEDDGRFHFQDSASNWLESLWNELTGKTKREYEEQYNNWLAERDDNSLDRTVDAYERLGLNKASLAGTGLTNSSLTVPDYGEGKVGAITNLASSASSLFGVGKGALDLLKGREDVISSRVDNILKSSGVPEAKFTKAMNEFAFSDKDGILGTFGQTRFEQFAQDLKNKADATQNEQSKLALDYLSTQLESLSMKDLRNYNDDGSWSWNDRAYELSYGSNKYVNSTEDFNFKKKHNQNTLNDESAKIEFAKLTRQWEKTNQDFREKYGEEQYKSLVKSNLVFDSIDQMNVPDGVKAVLMLLANSSGTLLGKL